MGTAASEEHTMRPIRHFGFLVEDADAFAKSLEQAFPALGSWSWVDIDFTEGEMIVGPACSLHIGVAYVDGFCLELVQAVDSPDSYQARNAQGLHHIAYVYEGDYEDEKSRLLAEGFTVEWAAARNNGEIVYYFRPPTGGYVIEVNNNFDYEKGVVRS
jgi:hypothetical protein